MIIEEVIEIVEGGEEEEEENKQEINNIINNSDISSNISNTSCNNNKRTHNKMHQQQINNNLNGASTSSSAATTNESSPNSTATTITSSSSSSSSPPCDSNGHNIEKQQQQQSQNGNNNGDSNYNDNDKQQSSVPPPVQQKTINLHQLDQDLVRLMGQHLKKIGLERTAKLLWEESGINLEHKTATKFRQHVMNGEWLKLDNDINQLQLLNDKPKNLNEMKFLLLEQKYLEFLENGKPLDALHVLRNELTPLNYNTPRVHTLSSYMMCANNIELYKRANWNGIKSRQILMERLQQFFPPSIMLPPQRLKTLLTQSIELQTERCLCHDMGWKTDINNVSLLEDHTCLNDGFPFDTLQILTEHNDEVWYCRFSPDGLKLATGSKDSWIVIWDVNPVELKVTMRKKLEGHSYGVSFITWSPDSKYIVAGGSEDCPEVWIWNVEEGKLHNKMLHSSEDSISCASFSPDGKKFVIGGIRGQFYLCDIDGIIHNSLEGIRINGLAFRSDNKTILAADTHHRIRSYNFDVARNDNNIIQETDPIMTFSIDSNDRLALLNVQSQGLHLWDLKDKCLIRRYQGVWQEQFTIYSCFGGKNESFIASGSEDGKIYIWHIKREEPLAKLSGHTRGVNCVHWNPVYTSLLASVSDDNTIRIWGPKKRNNNNLDSDVYNTVQQQQQQQTMTNNSNGTTTSRQTSRSGSGDGVGGNDGESSGSNAWSMTT